MQNLRVYPVGNLLLLDTEYAQQTGRRRYVGRGEVKAWTEAELPEGAPRHLSYNEFLEPGQKAIPHSAFPAQPEPAIEPNTSYYRKAVARGDLAPADAATAAACGVVFHT